MPIASSEDLSLLLGGGNKRSHLYSAAECQQRPQLSVAKFASLLQRVIRQARMVTEGVGPSCQVSAALSGAYYGGHGRLAKVSVAGHFSPAHMAGRSFLRLWIVRKGVGRQSQSPPALSVAYYNGLGS